ncbi:MAG: mycothiol system anti-sigma-R factor [Actinomycetota bacterium]|nr:mycothiol system anti-sigma-R factor [Actinomycetota bacterium]
MSHEISDCGRILHEIYTFLDGELTVDRRESIEVHLRGCNHCLSAYDFEAELRLVVRSKLYRQAPDPLRSRVLAALEAEQRANPDDRC